MLRGCFLFMLTAALLACSSNKPVTIDLMTAPAMYREGVFDPFVDSNLIDADDELEVFYATDRVPHQTPGLSPYYTQNRGHVLRLGQATIQLGDGGYTWDEARQISLLKNRSGKYPLQVDEVEELGALHASHSRFDGVDAPGDMNWGDEAFAAAINERLASTRVDDIYIYVHGYKVHFDNPILVSAELWHFLGYQGAVIAYSWPSTPSAFAYAKDLETTEYTARNFRRLLKFLADHTDAARIHIVGYSAGTRVVLKALYQLAMQHPGVGAATLAERYRIGQVLIIGSDYDRDVFIADVEEDLLNVPKRMTVYRSETDRALSLSSFLLARRRLGEIEPGEGLSQKDLDRLSVDRQIDLINVSDAEAAAQGKGHNYFRQSPWVSSDVLTTLRYQLSPAQRGLLRNHGDATWRFPSDYPERLRRSLEPLWNDNYGSCSQNHPPASCADLSPSSD